MLPLGEIMKRFEKLVVDNSPTILTAIGVTGSLTTAYLTGRASFKAAQILSEESPYLEAKEKVQLCWKLYIPAVGTAVLTVAAVIGANRIGSRRAAALAVAYSVSERAFEEYKSKVIERVGEKKEQAIRDEIAQARVDRDPVGNAVIIGEGRVLCYEDFTGRYFLSDMEAIRKAQNDINQRIITDSYVALSDLYDLLNLPHTSESSEVGWNTDKLLDIRFSAILSEGRPCISVGIQVKPIRNFDRLS